MIEAAPNGQLCDSMSIVEIALGDSLAVELAALTRAALVQIQVPQPLTLISMYRAVGSLPAVAKTPVAGFTPR